MNSLPIITSRSNARVKALRTALSGKASAPGELLGLEGKHLIQEAHSAGFSFETIFVREGDAGLLEENNWIKGLRAAHWAALSRDVFDSAVSTTAPQGIVATWIIKEPVLRDNVSNVLVLESIQDPGNFGTLIRSAFAFGANRIMVTPDTVNRWNPKVMRSAAGAMFHVQVFRRNIDEIMAELRTEGHKTFAAVAGVNTGPEYGYPSFAAPHGVLTGRVENADADRRYADAMNPPKEADQAKIYAASLCYDTDFIEPCAILIGNEGAGLSRRARELADEQVIIPSSAESLNAAVAGSVLLYEVMRQRTLRLWARKQGYRP